VRHLARCALSRGHAEPHAVCATAEDVDFLNTRLPRAEA